VDQIQFTLLASRIDRVLSEVSVKCIQSAHSAVAQARDFSVAVADGQARTVSIHGGLPIHTVAIDLALKPVIEMFDDIRPGDVFLNNSPYHGNVHHADYTFLTPVFSGDRIIFWVILRMHNVDVGAAEPTPYPIFAKDVYQEGLYWPCVRVARDYAELSDVVRIGLVRIRVPAQWYGDFSAALGSSWIGEKRLRSLIEEQGVDVIEEFVEEWLEYGRRRMIEEIESLPEGTWEQETLMDPLPFAPDGIKLKVKLTIDHGRQQMIIDLRENPDQVEGGINLPHASSITGISQGIFACLDYTLPHNSGAFSCIKFLLREGSIAGIPKFPASTAVSTSYVADRLTSCLMALMAQVDAAKGAAEGGYIGWWASVFSGKDYRHDLADYISQPLIVGSYVGGGPGVQGHDGWPVWGMGGTQGNLATSSVEIWEKKHPQIFDVACQVIEDSAGAGEYNGSIGQRLVARQRQGSLWVAGYGEGKDYPPSGVLGGGAGAPNRGFVLDMNSGERIRELPLVGVFEIEEGQALEILGNGGGGFGEPLDRDPESVRVDVTRKWLSIERARDTYGVVLHATDEGYEVDYDETLRIRRKALAQSAAGLESSA